METRKLYYEDSHLAVFTARAQSCEQTAQGWEVTLDATAFYPEGGGQACDLGTLGNANVLDVRERGTEVVHLCDSPLEVGTEVQGRIDYPRRFRLMQQHSGEHIVSGIINRRYGFHNVGFHMGSETMVIDFDGVVPAEALPEIELEANRAVWANLSVRCWYPSPEALPNVPYRTKKVLPWPVRIVEIPGVDACACCGTHVTATGEIGLIKLFSAMGCRGGTRIEMACGYHAYALMNQAFHQNRLVSQAFSAKWPETGAAAQRMSDALEAEKAAKNHLWDRIFRGVAEGYVNSGDVVHFEEGLDPVQLRELADAIADRCGGTAAVFSGSDEAGYGFAMVTRQGDIRALGKALTGALGGRGGGKPNFQQGRVCACRNAILAFFRKSGEEADL